MTTILVSWMVSATAVPMMVKVRINVSTFFIMINILASFVVCNANKKAEGSKRENLYCRSELLFILLGLFFLFHLIYAYIYYSLSWRSRGSRRFIPQSGSTLTNIPSLCSFFKSGTQGRLEMFRFLACYSCYYMSLLTDIKLLPKCFSQFFKPKISSVQFPLRALSS